MCTRLYHVFCLLLTAPSPLPLPAAIPNVRVDANALLNLVMPQMVAFNVGTPYPVADCTAPTRHLSEIRRDVTICWESTNTAATDAWYAAFADPAFLEFIFGPVQCGFDVEIHSTCHANATWSKSCSVSANLLYGVVLGLRLFCY